MSTWGDKSLLDKPGLPVPRPSKLSLPHWEGCKRGELLVQRCKQCASYIFTPEVACIHCLSEQLEWVKSSGKGTIYSFTIIYRPQRPEFETPYVAVIIELEEGWHMLSNLIDCDLEAIKIGLAVSVHFVPRGDDMVLPMFKVDGLGFD